MARLPKTGRHGAAVARRVAVTVVCGLTLACCVPPPQIRSVWHEYLMTQAAYDGCRTRRHDCDAERAAYETARDAYRAAEAAHPWISIDGAR
ncbi:MAG TPA: hypothetical protein VG651_05830 [Stellaceae bacterium]|nr:hypothetical protein [Stellaceae bacterium]